MLYILALIIILYTSSHFLFRKNEIYLRVRKYIDIATIVVTSVLVITWVEIFNLSFLFIIYFFISLGIISYLISRLRKLEAKKLSAETVIKELKIEEKVLENEIEVLQNEEIKK
ncbi:MAG: hypothetical protein UR39_C0007G0043 [Candidatus Woesebacteria bacterium GW2011_GWA1_33_30]|uniref:Uncharacterized protein n=1 Tax=Candidatus Woesebacteria bacterium GW2011_GWA2_33_28 TaxID=1618561 RepID=A0A0G0C6N4_9BACT|nr:MAG: hypothetical protein UR38_C0007G0043 [Candidatus Woesebacteria bacterium GW2011_GWA2_33_28]KKP47825.1 MAG: hypothetical protein UR39_C0007G0043 [Candidatus Woesebacteria bacterium GW2011_GWA1_33_30]KKP49270.1 MAG: hypothetical protein UR40_C0008G0043 [Microgenomates group bacterium GW2011_GWC1_33_32]KKP51637.1 MAG: hypothetical protein UR44_C0008G0039 [Candidatus Woesebacteria bacterium GW2011_GWB1_33_38]KKP57630.1 MAG: hypothetical protein UR48_C0013G0005 [Microgenomates group bacteriu